MMYRRHVFADPAFLTDDLLADRMRLIRQPGELRALLRLGLDSARGLATLRRAAALAGPRLGFDPPQPA